MTNHVFDTARRVVAAGLSCIPIATNGSQAPAWHLLPKAWDERQQRHNPVWKSYQTRPPSPGRGLPPGGGGTTSDRRSTARACPRGGPRRGVRAHLAPDGKTTADAPSDPRIIAHNLHIIRGIPPRS